MTTSPITAPAAASAPVAGPAAASGLWRPAAAAALVLVSALLGWQGGAWGLGVALVVATALPWLLRRRPAGPADDGLDPLLDLPRVSGGRGGAEVMVAQVVPVWGKQLDITRVAAADGLRQLLDGFSQMSGALATLASQLDHSQVAVAPGAVDQALAPDTPAQAALQALLGPSQRAFAQRDAAVAQLVLCHDALQELRQLGRQAREVGEQVGEQMERVVSRLEHALAPERLRGELNGSTPEELRMALDLGARTALNGLLGAVGGALRSSGEIKAAAETLGQQLEATFVHFQFGDRLSQMLDIVAKDMQNFARWVEANPDATQSDAADWLANLAASYTMEEQRSQHHGNVHIARGSEIEFF